MAYCTLASAATPRQAKSGAGTLRGTVGGRRPAADGQTVRRMAESDLETPGCGYRIPVSVCLKPSC